MGGKRTLALGRAPRLHIELHGREIDTTGRHVAVAIAFNQRQTAAFKEDNKAHAMLDALNAPISTVEGQLVRQKRSIRRNADSREEARARVLKLCNLGGFSLPPDVIRERWIVVSRRFKDGSLNGPKWSHTPA